MNLRSILLGTAALLRLISLAPAAEGAPKAQAPDNFWVAAPRIIEGVADALRPLGLMAAPPVSTWTVCIAEVLQSEGGFVNDARDPGGATNMGITRAVLAEWRGRPVSVAEVRALAQLEAREIYRARYWNPIQGDALPAGLALGLFDFAVNSGIKRAVRTLQQVMGFRPADCDGVLGPATLRAIQRRDAAELLAALCDARLAFLQALSTFGRFGRGWTARVKRVLASGRAQMAIV
ncbi:glycoside hydrolase family 108 protein [Roseomonas mucosa]|uniref:glycoside hydrolase family 108 protein n=1 Tax=Roseomonas mucosa TaxID=207340 RepID=UPI00384BD82B